MTHFVLAGISENGTYTANCTCGWEVFTETLSTAALLANLHYEGFFDPDEEA